jgi:hypothetical protein
MIGHHLPIPIRIQNKILTFDKLKRHQLNYLLVPIK